MKTLKAKKFYLALGLFLLILALPLTLLMLKHSQNNRSKATAATVLSFSPDSSPGIPIQANVNDTITLDIYMDPSTNQISNVSLFIQYDPTRLSIDQNNGFQANTDAFPEILEGPIFTTGNIAVNLSIGSDSTRAISQRTKIASISLKAIGNTNAQPTEVSFTSQTDALSLASGDNNSENVIQSTIPAYIAISGQTGNPTSTPILTLLPNTPQPTTVPSNTPISSVAPTPTQNPIPTGPITTPLPTIPLPNITPGDNTNPGGLFNLITALFSNRIINIWNIFSQFSGAQQIPNDQLQKLIAERQNISSIFMQILQSLRNSGTTPSPTGTEQTYQAISAGLNGMFNDYQSSANELDSFSVGLQGVITSQQQQDPDMAAAQNDMDSVTNSLQSIRTLSSQSQASLQTLNQNNAKTVIGGARTNMVKIKSEFNNVNNKLEDIKQLLNN